tara:strand:+ start:744 stop:1079 length:336 start_codon:yes stop_codon:yes gene_type:complete
MKQGDKKKIIERLVKIPVRGKRPFWAREMKFLKDFMEEYPSLEFWQKTSFGEKLESLILLKGDTGRATIKRKFLEFNYIIPDKKGYNIGKKSGKDTEIELNPKTIRDFLKS